MEVGTSSPPMWPSSITVATQLHNTCSLTSSNYSACGRCMFTRLQASGAIQFVDHVCLFCATLWWDTEKAASLPTETRQKALRDWRFPEEVAAAVQVNTWSRCEDGICDIRRRKEQRGAERSVAASRGDMRNLSMPWWRAGEKTSCPASPWLSTNCIWYSFDESFM